ncbi:MAG: HTH domain-containing protein [Pseudomonadota bacterium]
MIEVLGFRQQELLRMLLKNKGGMTIDQLSQALKITRTAVRQHLSALEKDDLVHLGISRASGGRPEQLYILSPKGRELFPRHYSWIAELVLESIKQETGAERHRERLKGIGTAIGTNLRKQHPELTNPTQIITKLSEHMEQLGYDATRVEESLESRIPSVEIIPSTEIPPLIEASNCVFHNLAIKDPDICEFDRALLSAFTNSDVDHQTCMATGDNVCRFKFIPKSSTPVSE